MDYFPLERSASQSVIKCNNSVYCGNSWDYQIVFSTWFCYILFSIIFLAVFNGIVMEDYSIYLGIFSYFLSLPGMYYAIKCFSTDPGILKRGDLPEPELDASENDNPHPFVQDNGIIDQNNNQKNNDGSSNSNEQILANDNMKQEQYQNQELLNSQELQNTNNIINNNSDQVTHQIQMQELQTNIDQIKIEQKQKNNLLKSRYCRTCKIMRPPLSSHCSHCNNCVKNFDHHCFFMGNCIGERNQKYFVLFLIFTPLWALYAEIFVFLNAIETIKLYDNVIYDIYENDLLFIPLCVLGGLLFTAIMISCHQCIKGWLMVLFLADIVVISLYSYLQNSEIPLQDHPIFSIIMGVVYIGVILFVLPHLCLNIHLACKDTTLKQENFYLTFQVAAQMEKRNASCANFFKLIFKPNPKSEILN